MNQPESLRTEEGFMWVSPDYVKRQIEIAYQNALASGAEIKFHVLMPHDVNAANNAFEAFSKLVKERFNIDLKRGNVWRTN